MTQLSIGLPRMHKEEGERRDFLPSFAAWLERYGAQVVLETGYGSGMGFAQEDYLRVAPNARFASHQEVYQQDVVLVVRYPSPQELDWMRPGACLVTMVHYPTRPDRLEDLRRRGLQAISLDSIKDDVGRRLVENLRSVAWNGIEAAFELLGKTYPYPGFDHPGRPPVKVTLLGAGAVGAHVVQAAVRYGDESKRQHYIRANVPGIQVQVIDYDLTSHGRWMVDILRGSDILVDATQRPDPSRPVIPNTWVAWLPTHAVILDLSVDPYDCGEKLKVKGIEGIPQGNLDQYAFAPDDPVYNSLPECVSTQHRRHVVSCYSWPGVHPKACMEIYGRQLRPLMRNLIGVDGPENLDPGGRFFERALARASLANQEL